MSEYRKLRLGSYEIDDDHYAELKFFCKRYKKRESEINKLYGLSEINSDGMPKGNTISRQTENKALRICKLRSENEMIEQSAIEADSYIYQDIIKNVTQGIGYDYLNCPCSRGYFYDRRRKFYKILSEKR